MLFKGKKEHRVNRTVARDFFLPQVLRYSAQTTWPPGCENKTILSEFHLFHEHTRKKEIEAAMS